jgi:two-component system cell cycle response regulator
MEAPRSSPFAGRSAAGRHPPRIVLAEDEALSRALLVRQLRGAGYDVIPCENGKQALDAIRREVSCIVVADWMMPEMDGLELCRAVRDLGEMQAVSFVYFILLTAHTEKERIVTGLEAGADDYLTKPYHPQELLARLRVGQRNCILQSELFQRQVELQKANAELAVLNAKLEKLASSDALTGLANRRHLFDRLGEVWALAARKDRPLSCIMFDVDKFKLINDTHGHLAGDEVLRGLADVFRNSLRTYDVIGRFGGEEFCVLCPETTTEDAAGLAERIRLAVAESQCVVNDTTISITVSLGVAGRSPVNDNPDALIVAADTMLYRAKENGRNQVWVCDADGRGRPVGATVDAT